MRLLTVPVRPKKLPDSRRAIRFSPDMPEGWKTWLRDSAYWNVELESDAS